MIVGSPRSGTALQRPPDAAKIGVWRTALSVEECHCFEAVAGDLLMIYGYPLLGG